MKKLHTALSLSLASALMLFTAAAASADNMAPVAENMEIRTYRETSVSGSLSAVDPDGEELTFEISTPPIKGELELEPDGSFVYTPGEGKRGKDYFGYKATDASGNVSHEATVIISIDKPKSDVCYSDMDGNGAAYAAARLAEEGIFIGECLGGDYVFSPDEEVTRGEFLAMCMKLAEVDLLSGVQRTGFADDAEIDAWMRPYVSTALMCGAISGISTADGAVFEPSRGISGAEATVMLSNILGVGDVGYLSCSDTVPEWAAQSVMNLEANGVIVSGEAELPVLTRAEAALMLCRALEL